jgi:hypothetical protein
MKRMFFLMLTLMVMGVASMNAQVRIGGTADPDKSAVLDLNGDDGTATAGLALPSVALNNNTQIVGTGDTNKPGTVVYSEAGTLEDGLYVWTKVNGTDGGLTEIPDNAVTLAKIHTELADSGKVPFSNGADVVWRGLGLPVSKLIPTVSGIVPEPENPKGLYRYYQATHFTLPPHSYSYMPLPEAEYGDICTATAGGVTIGTNTGNLYFGNLRNYSPEFTVQCYHVR